jgi:hypothetical protein
MQALQYLRANDSVALAREGGSDADGTHVSDPSRSPTPVAESGGVYNTTHLARMLSIGVDSDTVRDLNKSPSPTPVAESGGVYNASHLACMPSIEE